MDEEQLGSVRRLLRIAAGLVIFGVFLGLRHFFLVEQSSQSTVPLWFWLTLVLAAGLLVGAVEFKRGVDVYGVLIGAAASVLGVLLHGLIVLSMVIQLELWQDSQRSFDALVVRGPALMLGGFLLGAALTGPILLSFIRGSSTTAAPPSATPPTTNNS